MKLELKFIQNLTNSLFQKGSFVSNISVFTGGAFLAYFVGFIFTPLITRLYLPSDYGQFALFMTSLALLIAASSLSYSDALLLTIGDKNFYRLSALVIFIGLGISIFLFIFALVFSEIVLTYFDKVNLKYVVYLLPVLLLINTFQIVAEAYNIKRKAFNKNAISKVASITLAKSTVAGAGFIFGSYAIGLILGEFILRISNIVFLLKRDLLKFLKNIFSTFRPTSLVFVAKKFRKYPMFIFPSTIFLHFSVHFPIFIIGKIYSLNMLGYYSLAISLLSIPVQIIGFSMGKVFLQRATEIMQAQGPEKIRGKVLSFFYALLIISSFGYGIVFGFGPSIFSLIAGENWVVSGQIAAILAVALAFQLIAIAIGPVFRVLERERIQFIVNFSGAAFLLVLLFAAANYSLAFMDFIKILAVGITIKHLLSISVILKTVKIYWIKHVVFGLLIMGIVFYLFKTIGMILF